MQIRRAPIDVASPRCKAKWMIYNGAAVREKLTLLRDAMMAAKDRTELDPFDDALFNAVHYMIELSGTHSAAVETMLKSMKKVERKIR